MSCLPCQELFSHPSRLLIHDLKTQKGALLHSTSSSLETSATNGCPLCQLLLTHTTASIESDSRNKHRHKICAQSRFFKLQVGIHVRGEQTNHHVGSSTLVAHVEVKSRFGGKEGLVFAGLNSFYEVVLPRSVESKTLARAVPGREVEVDPNSSECIALVKQWITECELHERCKVRLANRELPSRTIDVGPEDGSVEPRLCVQQAETITEDAFRWIALSHRWGEGNPTKTVTATYHEYQTQIPFRDLPLTFQDAVTVTRKLGFRHLWIDSLCIIQDDQEDWEREYPKMDSIFEQAYLTLAADNAIDCTAGLLRPRLSRTIASFPWTSSDQRYNEHIKIRRGLRNWKGALGGQESHLHSRGWVLQEDLLSPRALHFGREQLFWECRTHRRSESLNEPLLKKSELNLMAGKSLMHLVDGPTISRRTSNDPDLLVYSEWAVTVRNYTHRQLTYEKDKLPALVGLAQAFQRRLKTSANGYYAGMWENNLHKDLLWRTKYGKTLKAVPGRAPSWSWASVDGAVLFPRFMSPSVDGCLADFHVDETDDWPFRSPSHVLQSLSFALTVSSFFVESKQYDQWSNDVPPGYSENGIRLTTSSGKLEDILCYFDFEAERTKFANDEGSGFAIVCISKFLRGDSDGSIIGLLLAQNKSGEYRRLGTTRLELRGIRAEDQQHALRGWEFRTLRIG